jgi:putative radical SAM enzyme (TIGR03279 family)
MDRTHGEDLGIRFKDRPIHRCCNNCIFCFIDQMPLGLLKSLYVKDEDYRYSFTNGNYLTLSRASPGQLSHIIEMGLSPLYISVHATAPAVRNRMLGNTRTFDIMDQLRFLEKNDVRFHAQIVVCPGINDGRVLKRSIEDLLSFKTGLMSIAVVPVGLTRYRKNPLQSVTAENAHAICRDIALLSDADFISTGARRVFLADEFFIKAGKPIPPTKYYEDFPQIENGVGLIRQLLQEWKSLKRQYTDRPISASSPGNQKKKKYLVITSASAFAYIASIMREMEKVLPAVCIETVWVRNAFFGESVTVAGLLTAHDLIATAKPIARSFKKIFIPSVMFNVRGYTMDGFSKARLEKQIKRRIEVISDLSEMITALQTNI